MATQARGVIRQALRVTAPAPAVRELPIGTRLPLGGRPAADFDWLPAIACPL